MKRKHDGVYLASNGPYWLAVWYDTNGARVRRSIGPKSKYTKTAATAECNRIAAKHIVQPGARDSKPSVTLAGWKERYFRIRPELSNGTETLARDTFDRLSRFFGSEVRLERITRAGAADFRVWLSEQIGRRRGEGGEKMVLSEQTVARFIRDCKVIFGWAYREDMIAFNPFDRISSSAPAVAKEWATVTRDQLEKVLEACPDQNWRSLFALCRLAGLRWGEAMRLTWSDVLWDKKLLRIRPPNGREDTKHSRREVPIEPRLMEVLQAGWDLADEDADRVCGLSMNNHHRNAQGIVHRAGLPEYSKPFHTLRKNLESEWLAEHPIMAVCEWLGHSPNVATAHYHRPTAEVVARVTSREPVKS